MIFNALDGNTPLDYEADVVIVGAGPAGITLSYELSNYRNVLLVEAGGKSATPEGDDSLIGNSSGIFYPLTETRARQFGGSTALWAGYCALFDDIDFESRSWVENSGWPISVEDLSRYYPAAAKWLHLDYPEFDVKKLDLGSIKSTRIREHFCQAIWRFGNRRADFAIEHRLFFKQSKSANLLENACITNVGLGAENDVVRSLTVRTSNGRQGTIRAQTVILATGGIEAPRLLLASHNKSNLGVGNEYGHVGRWFMEHPHLSIDGIELSQGSNWDSWTSRAKTPAGEFYTQNLGVLPKVQSDYKLLNARAHFFRTPLMAEDAPPRVGIFFEQSPNSASRISLTDKVDCFGMPRIRLCWEINETDRHSHSALCNLLAEALLDDGVAVKNSRVGKSNEILHSNHQLGTTRMSQSPVDGVVDPNCKVHGLSNLYIVGGSVFPTVSWANPTLTVLALTLRLADHLKSINEGKLPRNRSATCPEA